MFMPYTCSTDTNLREGPNPQVTLWTKQGRRVIPKMCQLRELHPRSNSFPNDITERLQNFYQTWAKAGVYGVCMHGGWYPGEHFGDYEVMEDNIGFGFNMHAHWQLLWDPFREDLDDQYNDWAEQVFGKQGAAIAKRCLQRAEKIQQLGPLVEVVDNPTYRDYFAYAAKADGTWKHLYPFGFDMILLTDKITNKFFTEPAFLHQEFVYNYQDYPKFKENLLLAYKLLNECISDLESVTSQNNGSEEIEALLEWFRVELQYLQAIDWLYQAEESYLILGQWENASEAYGQAYDLLHESLQRWGHIALTQKVWPFSVGGQFYPYRGALLDEQGLWLDKGAFGVFFRWLAARRDDPRGPDVVSSYQHGAWYFHDGLKRFRWPMQ